jgi:hypothetical protein
MEDHDKINESKNIQEDFLLEAIADIEKEYKEIKITKEKSGYYFIKFMDISSDDVYKIVDILEHEANIRGIYLGKETNAMKLKLSMAADIRSIKGFVEKLEEVLSKFNNILEG